MAASVDEDDALSSSRRLTVADLLQHGLTDEHACVGGVWLPNIKLLLCRSHVVELVLQHLDADDPTSEAVLMVGGPGIERALSLWCLVCRGEVDVPGHEAVVFPLPTVSVSPVVQGLPEGYRPEAAAGDRGDQFHGCGNFVAIGEPGGGA